MYQIRWQIKILGIICILLILGCPFEPAKVQSGLDEILLEGHAKLTNKSIGLITNHTAIDGQGEHIVDLLSEHPDFTVVALFGPEHGIRGTEDDNVNDGIDAKTGLPIYSLYGNVRKPTKKMLKDIDLLVFDIQDIGARFYTYISTMMHAMAAAAENEIPFVVLDRPNPVTGTKVEGPVLDLGQRSFVGIGPIPVRHGMTVGELSRMFNGEGWLEGGVRCDLTVIPVQHWKREQWFDETGLGWIQTSPNMPDLNTAILYPGICFLEATNLSEGRGTEEPFIQIGAPWIDSRKLVDSLQTQKIPGITFEQASFNPVKMEGRAVSPKYKDETCHGVRFEVTDRNAFESVAFGIRILCMIHDLHPDDFAWRGDSGRWMNLLSGTDWIAEMIKENASPDEIIDRWQADLDAFLKIREKYLLY